MKKPRSSRPRTALFDLILLPLMGVLLGGCLLLLATGYRNVNGFIVTAPSYCPMGQFAYNIGQPVFTHPNEECIP